MKKELVRLEIKRELKELRRPYSTLSEALKEGLNKEPRPKGRGISEKR